MGAIFVVIHQAHCSLGHWPATKDGVLAPQIARLERLAPQLRRVGQGEVVSVPGNPGTPRMREVPASSSFSFSSCADENTSLIWSRVLVLSSINHP